MISLVGQKKIVQNVHLVLEYQYSAKPSCLLSKIELGLKSGASAKGHQHRYSVYATNLVTYKLSRSVVLLKQFNSCRHVVQYVDNLPCTFYANILNDSFIAWSDIAFFAALQFKMSNIQSMWQQRCLQAGLTLVFKIFSANCM